jgi:hypothetical protein
MSLLSPTIQPTLVDYGIQTEQSDLRVHVCVNAGIAYVYPTRFGLAAVNTGEFRKVKAYQPGVNYATAEGFLVPPSKIWGCLPVGAGWAIAQVGGINFDDDTSTKGRKAVEVVGMLLKHGYFPMWARPDVIDDLDLQIKGLDIIVRQTARIQVKCDYEGGAPPRPGPKGKGVTGNLFLQVAEINPLKRV